MILNIIFIFSFFYLIGNFFFRKRLVLENVVLGSLVIYLITVLSSFFINYSDLFLLLKLICFFSLFIFFLSNSNYKKLFNFNLKINVKLLIFLFFIFFIFFENIRNIQSQGLEAGDSLAYWFNKTKFFVYNPGVEYLPKSTYPNFLSSLWALSFFLFDYDYNLSRVVLPLIFIIVFTLVIQKINDTYSSNYLNLNIILFFIFLIYFSTKKFAGIYRFSNAGYADFALSAYLMLGFLYLYISFSKKNFSKEDYLFGVSILAFGSSIKNEGLIISLGLYFILNFIFLKYFYLNFKKNISYLSICFLIFVAISLFPLFLSMYLKSIHFSPDQSIWEVLKFSNFFDLKIIFIKIPIITKSLFLNLLQYYLIFFILSVVFVFKFSSKFIQRPLLELLIYLSIFFIIYIYSLYLASSWDLSWHLATSLDRIIYHFCGLFVCMIFLILNSDIKTK